METNLIQTDFLGTHLN
ncbi:hypothetical protein [Crocosphaera sp.]